MTKTRKPAAITFPLIAGTKIRRNAETGIEIHSSKLDIGGTEYTIYRTDREGTLSYWGTEYDLHNARALGTERVEMVREEVAEAHAEALRMNGTEEQRIADAITEDADAAAVLAAETDAPAQNVIRTLLFGAVHSAGKGFTQVGRDRLARAIRILDGTDTVASDAEAAATLAETIERMPVGALVRTTDGRFARVEPGPRKVGAFIEAETNRVMVPLSFNMIKVGDVYRKQGYGTAYLEDVTAV